MREGGRAVALDEEVADPRQSVAGRERDGQPRPARRRREEDQQREARERARGVQPARRRPAVLGEVVRPELFVCFELAVRHKKKLPAVSR